MCGSLISRNAPLLTMCLGAFFSITAYGQAPALPRGTLPEASMPVSDHVQMIKGFPNIGIVTGSRATLVVDTGLGPRNGATITRVAKKIADRPILYLTTTHFHPEHAGGDAGFPPGTILVRSSVQQAEINRDGQAMITRFSSFNKEFGDLLSGEKLRAPDILFKNEVTLDLGGVSARIMWLGAGHTRGDQLIFVEPDGVLISGDIVQNKIVPAVSGENGSLESWIRVLDQLAPLKPRIVVPTHSSIGDGSLIGLVKSFIVDMRARTLEAKQQGMAVEEAIRRMSDYFKMAYPDWAKSTEWDNAGAIPGFVQRVYAEAK
jgi:glyoxylase-like metal-dependent hydrolase (beta-lactamase superfamily II)